METPTAAAADWLRSVCADPAGALVAFDFDGTLAPIVDDPDSAVAHPDVPGLLAELATRLGHLAVITGRPAGVAAAKLDLASVLGHGDVVVLGHYGLERWDSATGQVQAPPPHAGLARVRRELPRILESADAAAAHVEDKTAAVAVHTRRMTDPAGAIQRLRGPLRTLADETGLALEPGRMVLELRPPGVDKGGALRAVARETHARSVAFAGDDLGDIAAFDAVDGLRTDGVRGLLVCSGSAEEQTLAARADLVVDGPAGIVAWLRALLADLPTRG
ncbi:MAG TPA: trehalose-phosphatase [Nocardioidaceae bacterium]|nr:trehalose-phosphatase [Nocardioidaceae bacterium]